jgi:hypothetical protein
VERTSRPHQRDIGQIRGESSESQSRSGRRLKSVDAGGALSRSDVVNVSTVAASVVFLPVTLSTKC